MATISNNEIKIKYSVDTGGIEAAAQGFDRLTTEERQAINELKKYNQEAKSTKSGLTDIGGIAGKIGGAIGGIFAVSQIKAFASEVVTLTTKFESMQKAINFASGSVADGAKNFEFLRNLSQKLGLDLQSTAEGYKTFAASSNLAGVSMEETNRQFTAVSKAVTALGLSSEDAKGVFLALGQIISKGTVQSEELRGQIGERLPGAFNLAAKSMGVTTQELGKMLQKGQVASKDFLPKFATELENAFGPAAAQNVNSLTASQNRFNSAIDGLILAVGNKLNPFLKGAYDLASGIAKQLSGLGGQQKKQDAESIAAKQTEADLAKFILKVSQDQGVWISRQAAARQLLLNIEDKQMKALEDRSIARVNADKMAEKRAQSRYDILVEEEKILTKIAGVEAVAPPPAPEVDLKALKKEFDARLNILELLKQQRILQGELANDPLAKPGAEQAFLEAKYKLQKEYAAKGLEITRLEMQNTQLERQVAEKNLQKDYEKMLIERKKVSGKTEKEIAKEREDTIKNANKRFEELEKDRLKSLDAAIEKEYQKIKYAEDQKQQAIQKTFDLSAQLTDGFNNLYQAGIQNQLSSLSKRYDEEIRLADGNAQKITEIENRRRAEEKALKTKAFQADQAAAVARVVFETAAMIAKWSSNPVFAPLAALSLAAQAAQIGFILAQPVPEFAEGTKGKPFKGGKAIVGERGVEKVVTESGQVYFTPPTATLLDLPRGSQVIPNHALSKQEIFWASQHNGRNAGARNPMEGQLTEIGSILKGLPITQINMDERGFEKYIRTERRTTKILNNRFPSA